MIPDNNLLCRSSIEQAAHIGWVETSPHKNDKHSIHAVWSVLPHSNAVSKANVWTRKIKGDVQCYVWLSELIFFHLPSKRVACWGSGQPQRNKPETHRILTAPMGRFPMKQGAKQLRVSQPQPNDFSILKHVEVYIVRPDLFPQFVGTRIQRTIRFMQNHRCSPWMPLRQILSQGMDGFVICKPYDWWNSHPYAAIVQPCVSS